MTILNHRRIAAGTVLAACAALGGALSATSTGAIGARAASAGPTPPRVLVAHRLRPRRGAIAPGTLVSSAALFGDRVFADTKNGFALANLNSAQYPARTTDGGRSWRIDGPQVHIDAADAPEAVSYVGVAGARKFFAYGSSAIDVTTDGGRTWWETFVGGLVMAVVNTPRGELVAYVQQPMSNNRVNPAVTRQYVSRDGGRHWRYSTALGG